MTSTSSGPFQKSISSQSKGRSDSLEKSPETLQCVLNTASTRENGFANKPLQIMQAVVRADRCVIENLLKQIEN